MGHDPLISRRKGPRLGEDCGRPWIVREPHTRFSTDSASGRSCGIRGPGRKQVALFTEVVHRSLRKELFTKV